ncbi:hypothetical protein BAE44_0007034 [Dichanthelium oligosanthes]|uniref:F-box domain-containing protein n=1 Tax=Dichanthelium oligosanthes TaxID=888268 RepID=A0A1E5W3N6_9POAL|nr:hypothetical protein BAE44_0007034 [Dichanthelium oligosanthes]
MEKSPEMPQDILRRIFATLEIPDLVCAGSVCSSWRAAYTSLGSTGNFRLQQTPCLLINVHKAEPTSGKIVEISSLGQDVLFLGHIQSLCLHAEEYPQLKANHVYFTDDDYLYTTGFKNNRRDIGVFDLENNSSEEITTPQLCCHFISRVSVISTRTAAMVYTKCLHNMVIPLPGGRKESMSLSFHSL